MRTHQPMISPRRPSRSARRGVTLFEVLIVMVLLVMLAGIGFIGFGALTTARLRDSASMVVGAVRVGYNHASATGKATRLVFDFGSSESRPSVSLEEANGRHFVQFGDRAGGAATASDLEEDARAEAERIVEGPRAPRATFSAVTSLGFDPEKGKSGKDLDGGIFFRQIEVGHEDGAATDDRVYLYFWPAGQTEYAAIQLQIGTEADDDHVLTVVVKPLTGRASIERGPVDMPRPRDDAEASERDEGGF